MKRQATQANRLSQFINMRWEITARYLTSASEEFEGLWERNGAFYAQLSLPDSTTGRKTVRRVRLEDKDRHTTWIGQG
ncbi:MAG: hypothetical protein FJ403_18180 [Verrucomicrobia bacterium]|nr:hypothetical protein [Verrucomicrobiota bacterium]